MSALMIQCIGYMGLLAFIISYQTRKNRKLFLLQMLGVLLFALQFVFLGAYSGCLSLLLIGIRNILLSKYHKWEWVRKWIWPVILSILFTVILYVTWAGPISLLSYVASVVSTFVYWTNNARNLRIANLFVCNPCWIIYDIIIGSWGGIASESLTMISIIVSIIRFGWKNLGKKEGEYPEGGSE